MKKTHKISLIFIAAGVLFLLFPAIVRIHPVRSMITDEKSETAAAQPAQPASGPGGSDYKHADITAFEYGEGNGQYWIFEPSDPKPESAPVIVFLHGWSAMYPKVYGGWIRHLVLRGNIVIYPRYQESLKVPQPEMYDAAVAAVKDALAKLEEPEHVRPDLARFAVVGHSLGGVLTADLAALSGRNGLPVFRAAMPVEPGDTSTARSPSFLKERSESIIYDYSTIPPDTLLLCVVGEDDKMAGDVAAVKIFNGAAAVPAKNKNFIIIRTDRHGTPPLVANHAMPVASDDAFEGKPEESGDATKPAGPIRSKIKDRMEKRREEKGGDADQERVRADAFDFYGTWRLFDALTDCAFYKKNCDYALGDSEKVRFMGKWSDGMPVEELEVTSTPGGK